MHVVHWKKQAINDLIKIALHVAQDSLVSAEKMVDVIGGKVEALQVFPNLGRIGRKRGTRELIVHQNYLVVYRVVAKYIEILRVKHSAQQWPPA